jgi:GNAT superfamily N-acetyltransferase
VHSLVHNLWTLSGDSITDRYRAVIHWAADPPPRHDQRMTYTVRRSRSEDWRDLRAVRLAALADAPTAFVTTLAQASAYSDEEWQRRAAGSQPSGEPVAGFLAYSAAGEPVGMLGGGVASPERALVWGVWVAPEHRGSGLAEQLMAALEHWARDEAGGPRAAARGQRAERAGAGLLPPAGLRRQRQSAALPQRPVRRRAGDGQAAALTQPSRPGKRRTHRRCHTVSTAWLS